MHTISGITIRSWVRIMCSTQHIRETLQHEVTHENDDRYIGRANEEGQNSCRQRRDHLKIVVYSTFRKRSGRTVGESSKSA